MCIREGPHEGEKLGHRGSSMTTVIDRLTLSTVPLEQYFNDTRLGQGTGFMWRAGGRDYLVTNWHVLSNRNLFTGKNLSANGGRPNRLRAMFNVKPGFFDRHQLEFKIRDDDDRPLWLVHPTRQVDIAVLPIDVVARPINSPNNPTQLPLYPINELANAKLRIGIGMGFYPWLSIQNRTPRLSGMEAWEHCIRATACLPYVGARVRCEAKRVHAC